MELRDALDAVIQKEEEGKKRLEAALRKADSIRYKGEEEASELYRKTREQLKKQTIQYKSDWKKKLDSLEREKSKELQIEKRKMESAAEKRRKRAEEAAYAFLVSRP